LTQVTKPEFLIEEECLKIGESRSSKPAIGVLDLATGAATAVRESSRSVNKQLPKRMRPPRLVLGPGGSMPVFSDRDGVGQEMMYKMNGRDYNEIYVSHEQLRSGEDDLQILITSDRVVVFGGGSGSDSRQLLTVGHHDLVSARSVSEREESGALVFPGGGAASSPTRLAFEDKFYVEVLIQGRNSPIFLQFFYLFSIFFLNSF
jgi:hypothetical protein